MQKGLKVKAGTTILLEAEVFGKPMPRVTWKRGDDSLKSAEGQVITQQRHHFQLEMTAVTKEHTGTYTILAENASGSKTADIQVNVLGEYFHVVFGVVFRNSTTHFKGQRSKYVYSTSKFERSATSYDVIAKHAACVCGGAGVFCE